MNKTTEQLNTLAKGGIEKIVVNSGIGRIAQQANFNEKLPEIEREFALVTGQKPAQRAAKQSIAGFKIREGNIIGLMATLRGRRMVDFFSRVMNIVLPRVRDFRGISLKSLDGSGNLTVGIKEHIVFPEMGGEIPKVNFGIQFTVVPKIKGRTRALELFKTLGVPFERS